MRSSRFLLSKLTIRSLVENETGIIGRNVTVNGWVRSVRRLKNVAFADVSDGTTFNSLPVVMSPDQSKGLTTGACVEVTGTISESPGNQKFELQLNEQDEKSVRILGPADSSYPLQKKYHTPEYLRTIPAFRWKTSVNSSVLRYRSFAQSKISQYFSSEGFIQVNSPIITSSDCEGAGEVFSVNASVTETEPHFFDKPAYLSVSSQLHLEVYAAALSRVWNMAPAFRAEKSDTNRHLSEFWMVEAELAFTNDLEDIMTVAENMIRAAVPKNDESNDLLQSSKQNKSRQELMVQRWNLLLNDNKPWKRITYTEAIKLLNASSPSSSFSLTWGDSLSSEHEKYLAANIIKGPVFVTDYPKFQKPFYMKQSSDTTVACFDLLVPDMGELIGGSLREDNYDQLVASMTNHEMNIQDLEWYLDLRKYGSFPHGGYGMGFERLVCFICGIDNIRESIGFPRWARSIVC